MPGLPIDELLPGSRVLVFDHQLYLDDANTPPSVTMKPATVLRRYGIRSREGWIYPDLIDVRFDHRPERESRGHFTWGVRALEDDV